MPLLQISELNNDVWETKVFYNPTSQYEFVPNQHSKINFLFI